MKDTENIVEGTLSVTKDEIAGFLEKKEVSKKCICANGELHLAVEADGSPAILKMGDARDPGSEQWFYWLVCDTCCHSRFMSAGMIWGEIRNGEKKS